MQLQSQGKAGKGGKGTALAIRSGPSKGKGGGARKSKFGDLYSIDSIRVFHSSNFPVVQGDVNQCQPTVVEDKVGTYCHLLLLSL